MRRVVRFGAGLGADPAVPDADYGRAIEEVATPRFAAKAAEFAGKYAAHDPDTALATMIARCEAAIAREAA
jgi:hypothetical protein